MLGIAVYGVNSAEKQVFEQELIRRQQLQEAKRAVLGTASHKTGGISKVAASIRKVVRSGPATERATATVYE